MDDHPTDALIGVTGDADDALDNLKRIREQPENLSPWEVEDDLPDGSWLHNGSLWVDVSHSSYFSNNQKASLTDRRKEILKLLYEGMNPVEVAEELDIEPGSIYGIRETFEFILENDQFIEAFLLGRRDLSGFDLEDGEEDETEVETEVESESSEALSEDDWRKIIKALHENGSPEMEEIAWKIVKDVL